MIGIFWFYKGRVLGKAHPLAEGEQGFAGAVDSYLTHVNLWPKLTAARQQFPELKLYEYEEIPRGRVVFKPATAKQAEQFVVCLDEVLLMAKNKQLISSFFKLENKTARWIIDDHYTTCPEKLAVMFHD